MDRKRALLVRFGAIGDVIMVIPVAHELVRRGFEIDWLCGTGVQPLLECYSWVKSHPVNEAAILTGSTWQRARTVAGVWSSLLGRRYDLCATLYYDQRYLALTLPVRARRKVRLSQRSRAATLLAGRSYTDEFARIVLGIEDGPSNTSLSPKRPDCLPPSPLPEKNALRRVALIPGGASNLRAQQILKRWPVEFYVSLAKNLLQRGWEVLLVGGPDDTWVLPSFAELNVRNCIGKLSLSQVISVCDTCDVVVSHDTGPMHLAGLSRARLVGLFGPTDPGNFLPRRPGVIGLWGGQGYACRPCYNGRGFAPCQSAGCMREISPDLVLEQLDRLLQSDCLEAKTVSFTA
ncbi:MAG: glycosyltransferase family 9 protein [Acidobacteriota bacterium]